MLPKEDTALTLILLGARGARAGVNAPQRAALLARLARSMGGGELAQAAGVGSPKDR